MLRPKLLIAYLVIIGLVLAVGFALRPRAVVCSDGNRLDHILGGGLPICFGTPYLALSRYGDRVRRDPGDSDASHDWHFEEGGRQYRYSAGSSRSLITGETFASITAACVDHLPGATAVDSIVKTALQVMGTGWQRHEKEPAYLGTTWRTPEGAWIGTGFHSSVCISPAGA